MSRTVSVDDEVFEAYMNMPVGVLNMPEDLTPTEWQAGVTASRISFEWRHEFKMVTYNTSVDSDGSITYGEFGPYPGFHVVYRLADGRERVL